MVLESMAGCDLVTLGDRAVVGGYTADPTLSAAASLT